MENRLKALHQLACMQHDAEMAQLAQHNRSVADIEQRILSLRQQLARSPSHDPQNALPLALTSGHFDTWQRWVEQELSTLNIKLARRRAEREEFIENARQAFGRKEATSALLQRQTDETRQRQQKKDHEALQEP